ncbi:hypothetical protein EDC01DRAFT_791593 [Geopyxis carbonaria]|nr:hypothetical protein EDC01DRAFT_791593 [Geopyxis carbonaria]
METQDTTIEEQDTTVEEPENIPLFKPGAWLIMATRKLRKHPMLPKANTDMIRLGLGAIILGPEPEAKAKEAGANYDIRGFVKDPNSKTFQHIMTRHKDEDRKALPVVMAIYNLYTDRWEEADKWLNHKTRSDRGDPVRPQVHRKRTETLKAQIIQRRREEELNDLQLAATTPLQQGINTNNSSWQAPLVNHPNVLNSVTNETPQAANVPKTPRETYVDETGYIRRVGSGSHPQILGQGTNTNNFQWQANLVDDPNLLNSVPNETPQAANVPKKPKETYVDETGYIRRVGSGSHQQIFGQGITTNNLQWQATSVDDPNMLNSVPNETPQAANEVALINKFSGKESLRAKRTKPVRRKHSTKTSFTEINVSTRPLDPTWMKTKGN